MNQNHDNNNSNNHNNNDLISKTFCVLPWIHLATTSTGNIRVCCNSTPGKNLIRNQDGTPYNLKNENAGEFWHSSFLTAIREQMLKGEHVDICERCYSEEKMGIKSARQSWNERWLLTTNNTNDRTKNFALSASAAAKDAVNIKYIDLRLGNLCNLKCRMCNPYSSDQWVEDWNLLTPLTLEKPLSDSETKRLKSLNWFNNETVWKNLSKYAETVEEIYLTGGEPTLATAQYTLLEKLIELGVAKNITLKYNTNLTNIPQKIKYYWRFFKKIKINASIDAYGKLNNYIRFPSKWKKIEQNLFEFKKMALEHGSSSNSSSNIPQFELQVHTTVQMYNILKLHELFDFLFENQINNIFLNVLNHPKHLNIKCLPPNLKHIAMTKLKLYHDKINKINGLIDYMNSDFWPEQLHVFYKFTETLDQKRQQNFFDLVPEFKEFSHTCSHTKSLEDQDG